MLTAHAARKPIVLRGTLRSRHPGMAAAPTGRRLFRPSRSFPHFPIEDFPFWEIPAPPYPAASLQRRRSAMKKSRHSQKYRRILHLLRQLREDRGLLQSDVAKRFGAYASFVSKCESGERRIDVVELAEFCQAYGISVHEFLKRAGIE